MFNSSEGLLGLFFSQHALWLPMFPSINSPSAPEASLEATPRAFKKMTAPKQKQRPNQFRASKFMGGGGKNLFSFFSFAGIKLRCRFLPAASSVFSSLVRVWTGLSCQTRDVYILLPSRQVEGAEARENEKSNLFAGTWANSWLSGVSKFFLFNKTQQSRLSQEALFASFSTSGPTF